MNSTAISSAPHSVKTMSAKQKKLVAVTAFTGIKTVTDIARENNSSRKFVRKQKGIAADAIESAFHPTPTSDKVLFHLPVTRLWIEQLVLSLIFTHVSYRHISTLLNDVFDYSIGIATISKLFKSAVQKAQQINSTEDLSGIHVTANDELFYHNKPILTGVDTRSLYCYILSAENHRDEDTWAIHFLDCQEKGLEPQRTIGDDAKGLVSAHSLVFLDAPYHYDNFHLSLALMKLRLFYRNRLKTAITERKYLERQSNKWSKDELKHQQFITAKDNEIKSNHISETLDILISWLEHDILNKAGPSKNDRRNLYDFVVDEFKKLESIEPHRISTMRTTLENKREAALGFVDVLEDKFTVISQQFEVDIQTVWSICLLQRCHAMEYQYTLRSGSIEAELGDQFDDIEDAVITALYSTERTSSMVENLNGRVRKHLYYRQESGHGFLDLLRFYLNHTPLLRSTRAERHKKSPAEILSGKVHSHWLEMLGYERFKRVA